MGGKVNYQSERERARETEERQRQHTERRLRQGMEDRQRAVGFAASRVLPGENQAEFDELLEDLRIEFAPEGPAQDDAVESMAQAIFRKRHLEIFQRAAHARMRWGDNFDYPGDEAGLFNILSEMAKAAMKKLEADKLDGEKKENGDNKSDSQADDKSEAATSAINQEDQAAEPERLLEDFPSIYSDLGVALWLGKFTQAFEAAHAEGVGPPMLESVRLGNHISRQIALAMQGDLITPSCFLAELHMIETLDRMIEGSHARLMKMKDAKSKNRQRYNDPLLPQWRRRQI